MQELVNLLSRARRDGLVSGEPVRILPASSGPLNEMRVIECADGSRYYWKRFLDRSDLAWLEHPAERMRVEARALDAFRPLLSPDIRLPIVLLEDETNHVLLLSDVSAGDGGNWQDLFLAGNPEISLDAADRLGTAFAKLADSAPDRSLRCSFEADAAHWEKWLRLRTIKVLENDPPVSEASKRAVADLYEDARVHVGQRLMHVDFIPKNIVVSNNAGGLVDFELATASGDAASEFGFFLGHIGLLLLNRSSTASPAWSKILDRIAMSYASLSQPDDVQQRRTMRYAGAAILYRLAGVFRGTFLDPRAAARQLALAERLLIEGPSIRDYAGVLTTQ